jgi:Ca2+-binding RTX toxin-like protein
MRGTKTKKYVGTRILVTATLLSVVSFLAVAEAHNPHGDCSHHGVASADYEHLIRGTNSGDVCNGVDDGDAIMEGFEGPDEFDGLGGSDYILGDAGHDVLRGGPSNTSCTTTDCAREFLKGGAGNDRLFGEQGRDGLRGGKGNDRLLDGLHGGDRDFVCDGEGDDFINVDDDDNNDKIYLHPQDGFLDTIVRDPGDDITTQDCPLQDGPP